MLAIKQRLIAKRRIAYRQIKIAGGNRYFLKTVTSQSLGRGERM